MQIDGNIMHQEIEEKCYDIVVNKIMAHIPMNWKENLQNIENSQTNTCQNNNMLDDENPQFVVRLITAY